MPAKSTKANKAKNLGGIRSRIVELRSVRNSTLKHNDKNYRVHPEHQRELIRALFGELGFVDCLIGRDTVSGIELIDGHMRSEESPPDAMLPVLILDLNDEEVAKMLAMHDPVSAMAINDAAKHKALLEQIETNAAAIRRLVTDKLDGYSEAELTKVTEDDTKRDVPGMHLEPHEHYDYLVVLCSTAQEWNMLCDKLKLEQNERRGRMGTCRAMRAWQLLEALGVERDSAEQEPVSKAV